MRIVIDPGHGGTIEIGGSSPNNAKGPNGRLEKQVTLEIGLLARNMLVQMGADCRMTRTTDVNLGLTDRAKLAKEAKAEVFVSIHFNGYDGKVQGTETFYHVSANQSSKAFANAVQLALLGATGLRDRGTKGGKFTVIDPANHDAATAACLCEVSFMDVASEEARLNTDA